MIQITDKHKCCGCEACAQACPKSCISMKRDAEGFLYPYANPIICIECGLCEKVCPVINQNEPRQSQRVFAAINKNEEVRKQSSSGGIFTLLAEQTISKGGVVFGIRFDENWQVVMNAAETMEEVKGFQGSKYIQARIGDCYSRCKEYLKYGRDVLFTGTPCQIAGLNHYLRKDYDNLLTVEVVCHGAPSPLVWSKYLKEAVNRGGDIIQYDEHKNVVSLSFPHLKNTYMRAYLSDLISRPSCSSCPAKDGRSHADITLADFWGIEREIPSMDDNKGTSMVLAHTAKGMAAIPFEKISYQETNTNALRHNTSYSISSKPHTRREEFFDAFERTNNIHSLIEQTLRPTLNQRLANLRHLLFYTKRMAYNILRPVIKPAPNLTGGGVFINGAIL